MATRTLSSFPIKNWPSAWGASGKLVITLSRSVVSDGSDYVMTKNAGASALSSVGTHWEAPITVAGGVGTTDPLTGLINTDTATPDHVATYDVWIYDSKGKLREKRNPKPYHIHESLNGGSATFTWAQWVAAMEFAQFRGNNVFVGDRATVEALVAANSSGLAGVSPNYGTTALSVTPVSAADPIAVGDNDPRVRRATLVYSGDGSLIVGAWVKLVAGAAVITATTDTAGCIGVVVSGGANYVVVSTGGPTIAHVNDSVISIGDYLQISDVATGTAISVGATYPTSGQVLGRALEASSGGLILVDVFGTEVRGSLPGGEAITDVTKAPYLADKTGATDASAAIRSAIATGAKRIYLPAGTYLISQAQITANGTIFNLTGEGVELFGDGQGLTKITVPASVTWHPSDSVIVQLSGRGCKVRGISFIGTNTVVSGHVIVIANAQGGYFGHSDDFEITGFGDGTSAGAALVTTYQPWNATDVSTTLGTTIGSGSQTVTPPSMTNIWKGRLLVIGGTTETVTVTAVTSTTFTATFANAHNSADSVTGYSNGSQGARVTNFNIHDNPRATAITNNSLGNTFAHGKIKRVGITSQQHALYNQAGQAVFDDIESVGIGGYGIHHYPTYGGIGEQSGAVYTNLRFTDVANFDVFIAGDARHADLDDISNGTNIHYPAGAGLDRYTTITNCLFRHTSTTNGTGIGLDGPTIFTNNVLEDVSSFSSRSPYSRVHSNIVRRLLNSPVNAPKFFSEVFGGGQQVSDNAPSLRQVLGSSAYPQAATNVSGGNLDLLGGIGVRRFAVLDNLSGGVTLTINITPNNGINQFTLVSGVDFNLGSNNTAAQLIVTAKNLAFAINAATNVYQYAGAFVVDNLIYLVRNPIGSVVSDITLGTNQAGRISVVNEANGFVQLWRPRLLDTSTASATAGAATLNTQTGVITSEALTTAAGSDYVLTLTNSLITASGAGSNVFVSVDNGTNTTEGLSVQRVTPSAGSVVIRIRNSHAADALNGTIKIRFSVF